MSLLGTGPQLSVTSKTILEAGAREQQESLPLEIMYNLRYQHDWKDLKLHQISTTPISKSNVTEVSNSTATKTDSVTMISGSPPRHMYLHPDILNHLIQHNISEDHIPIPREWVLPISMVEKWTLKHISEVFDGIPNRNAYEDFKQLSHCDSKRIFLGMLSRNGVGGDGTIVYYIMQEGEVKPRQN